MKSNRDIFFLLIIFSLTFSSCRMGEFLSEADTDTEAEIKRGEAGELDPVLEDDL